MTTSRGRCLCCLYSISLSKPFQLRRVGSQRGTPAQKWWWGWDKPATTHRLWPDGKGWRRHSFGGFGLIASLCEGLNCPHCGPFYTHAWRCWEGKWGVKIQKYVRNMTKKSESDTAKRGHQVKSPRKQHKYVWIQSIKRGIHYIVGMWAMRVTEYLLWWGGI